MTRMAADTLTRFATELLESGGFSPEHARHTAQVLVWANLRGTDSHGVLRIPRYLAMIAEDKIAATAVPEILKQSGGTALLDAHRAPGASAMNTAIDVAIELADRSGIGACVAREISHAGAVGYYASRAAENGKIGIVMTASGPLMSYHGASKAALSTNPLSIALPGSADPILLDMSTSAVALGKVLQAREAGHEIPEGWGIDAGGAPTRDPHAVETLVPMAGPKGSGLSLAIEIMCSLLAGNPVIANALEGRDAGMNGLALAIDISRFADLEVFTGNVDQLAALIKALPPAAGVEAVFLPGERGAICARVRERDGIPLAEGTCKKLAKLAKSLGIRPPPELAAAA